MATSKPKAGEVNLTVWLPEDLKRQLEDLAKKSGLTMHAYVREILINAQRDGLIASRTTEIRRSSSDQVERSQPAAERTQKEEVKPLVDSPTRADDKRMLDAAQDSLKRRPRPKEGPKQ